MEKAIHIFGQTTFLPWPVNAVEVYRVERWSGAYVATFANRSDAEACARKLNDRFDAKVIPLKKSA